jgi:hypothetical protein
MVGGMSCSLLAVFGSVLTCVQVVRSIDASIDEDVADVDDIRSGWYGSGAFLSPRLITLTF